MINHHYLRSRVWVILAFCLSMALPLKASELVIDESSFRCLNTMTPVRGFFVDNLMGDLQSTLEVAHSATGGVYPPGSVVQLVPGEVMVKHPQGVSPATKDWEFFELKATPLGSQIMKRGFVDVNNQFGGNCFACHIKARPEWDLICEQDHGCDPLEITPKVISLIQQTDPRCEEQPTLSPEDQKILADFVAALSASQSAE